MNELKKLGTDYLVDEFGRVVIQDIHLLEQIMGAGDFLFAASGNNYACGSNIGCANARCKK